MSYQREDNEFKNRMALKAAAMRQAHEQDERDEADRREHERLIAMAHGLTQATKAARKQHGVTRTKRTLLNAVMKFFRELGQNDDIVR